MLSSHAMRRIYWFLGGVFAGILGAALVAALQLLFLANFLVVDNEPQPSDAIVILGGDGSRLRPAMHLYDQGLAPRLVLTGFKKANWLRAAQKICPECRLAERPAVFLENSTDTHTDAQLSLQYCRESGLNKILIVTSPYHTRRVQFIFNDVFADSGIEPAVISSGDYGKLIPPGDPWWRHRQTLETLWLEFGKILYWELTPFMEFKKGEG